jgi:diguanylate cyclase (GGDEF)-like protein
MIEQKSKTMTKILIADDDLEILELLRFTFEQESYNVVAATDGAAALKMASEEHPDIVILDVNMPKLSGYEVLEKIRENSVTCLIPVIMLTSLSKTKDKLTGIKLGADEYLSKPFEVLELVTRVEGLLRRTQQSLSANPLTGLPGNISIENEIRNRLGQHDDFSVLYSDVDNFKSFNDKYGFERGDSAIRMCAQALRAAVSEAGNKEDFLGNIGGEDFVIITTPGKALAVCEQVIKNFDAQAPELYDEDARSRGYIWGINRQDQETQFPLMTISLGLINVSKDTYRHYSQVVEKAKEALKKAKNIPCSNCVVG